MPVVLGRGPESEVAEEVDAGADEEGQPARGQRMVSKYLHHRVSLHSLPPGSVAQSGGNCSPRPCWVSVQHYPRRLSQLLTKGAKKRNTAVQCIKLYRQKDEPVVLLECKESGCGFV